MESTAPQQGSGCGGLVWAQLLQPLSTESACQLLKVDMAKATRCSPQGMDSRLQSEHSSSDAQHLLPMTEDSCFSHEVKKHAHFLGNTTLQGLLLRGSLCLHHLIAPTEGARIPNHLPDLLPGLQYNTLPLGHALPCPQRSSSPK